MQTRDPDQDWKEFDARTSIEETLEEEKRIFAGVRLELVPHILLVMDDRMPRKMAFTRTRAEMRGLTLQLEDLLEDLPELVMELGEDMSEIIKCAREEME